MRNDLQVLPLTPTLGAEIAGTAEILAAWEPNRTPPDRLRAENIYAATTVECGTCGTLFRPARKAAPFCSTKCRVAAHRLAA